MSATKTPIILYSEAKELSMIKSEIDRVFKKMLGAKNKDECFSKMNELESLFGIMNNQTEILSEQIDDRE